MEVMDVFQDGKNVDQGVFFEADFDANTKTIEYILVNNSAVLDIVNVKFITGIPDDSYVVDFIPERIKPSTRSKVTISYDTKKIFDLAENPIPRATKFTYDTEANVLF